MKERVREAIEDLSSHFGDAVRHRERQDGGATVCISQVDLGGRYRPSTTDMWFVVPPNFGDAPIYPVYLYPQVVHVDGASLPFQQLDNFEAFDERLSVTQVSLSSPRWRPGETALSKVLSVLNWLRSR